MAYRGCVSSGPSATAHNHEWKNTNEYTLGLSLYSRRDSFFRTAGGVVWSAWDSGAIYILSYLYDLTFAVTVTSPTVETVRSPDIAESTDRQLELSCYLVRSNSVRRNTGAEHSGRLPAGKKCTIPVAQKWCLIRNRGQITSFAFP